MTSLAARVRQLETELALTRRALAREREATGALMHAAVRSATAVRLGVGPADPEVLAALVDDVCPARVHRRRTT